MEDRAPRRRKIPMSVEQNELARQKRNKKFDSSYILQPVEDGPGFIWPGLEVRNSPGKGNGVFATEDIPAGTEIPILGEPYWDEPSAEQESHSWVVYPRSMKKLAEYKDASLDARPTNDPYRKTPNFGLSIAMVVNEAPWPQFNSAFRESNYLQIIRDVKRGEEITCDYGHSYERVRRSKGYTIRQMTQAELKELDAIQPPEAGTSAFRVGNWLNWMAVLKITKEENTPKSNSNKRKKHVHTGKCEVGCNIEYDEVRKKKADVEDDSKQNNRRRKQRITKDMVINEVYTKKQSDEKTVQWLRANEAQIKSVVKNYPNIESNYHFLLSLAASKGKLETVKYLVSIGADLNKVSKTTGDDALSTALWFNEYDVADWLIQQGMTLDNAKALESRPDREIQDEVGAVKRYQTYLRDVRPARTDEEVISDARKSAEEATKNISNSNNKMKQKVLNEAIRLMKDKETPDSTIMTYLTRHEADWDQKTIDTPDKKGITLLMYASAYGKEQTVKYLLSKGANPAVMYTNKKSGTTHSPSQMAAANKHPKIVKMLDVAKNRMQQKSIDAGKAA